MDYSYFFKRFYFILIISFIRISVFAADFYVSPSGNDSNSGLIDNPFATIERAKQEVISLIKTDKNTNCIIWLADGLYEIENPVIFDSNDFNGNNKIAIKALLDANPVVSGGIRLQGWKKNEAGIWEMELPKKKKGNWKPRELFIKDKRASRARYPNDNYLRIKKVGDDRRTNFFFEKGDFPIPEKTKGVELVLLHDWSISRISVKEINSDENKLTAVDSIGAKNPAFFNLDYWEKQPRYFLENALEFLDKDFEWVFDSNKNKVYVKLPENKNPEELQIVIPFSEGLVELKGSENHPIKNIYFEGITFQHCAWQIPEMGYCGIQACHFDSRPSANRWSVIPASVIAFWAEDCIIQDCVFQNLGGSGLWLSTGCKNCTVSNSDFTNISGNGIMIGEGRDRVVNGEAWWKSTPEQTALGNTIKNCLVSDCGKQFYGAVGIWCGLTAETTIQNNEITELPYTGISIGWMWSPEPTPCRDNIIDGNHIHHIMQKLSDGGGIYMLGLQPGSKLINNHIHDVEINAGRAESNGMFLDEGITNVIVENNLIYNIAKSPLRFHKATTNLVKDNYLFCTDGNPPIRYNNTKEDDIEKVGNKVINDSDKNYKSILKGIVTEWNSKLK